MASTALTQARMAETQARFREADERIETTAYNTQLLGPVPFICECANADCIEIVQLRSTSTRVPVGTHAGSSSHQVTQGRRWPQGAAVIVNESVGYTLVDKVGVAGEIAEER